MKKLLEDVWATTAALITICMSLISIYHHFIITLRFNQVLCCSSSKPANDCFIYSAQSVSIHLCLSYDLMILTVSFVKDGEEGYNFIFTLHYTLENGLSSCLVRSHNDNFCSVISLATQVCQCFTDRALPKKIYWWVRKCGNICWNYTWCPSRVFLLLLPQWLLTSKSYLIPSEQHLTFYWMAFAIFASLHSAKALYMCMFL